MTSGHTDTSPERLDKTLQSRWVWAIALGSAVGWGAFILPTDWLETAGPVGAISGFLIGGLLMIVIAMSYGTLIRNFPVSGGELAFALVGFGRTHAFICGWFLTLGYACIVALNASALALLFRYLLPDLVQQGHLYTIAGYEVYLVEIGISTAALILFGVLNIRGADLSGRVQYIACIVMLVAVAMILIAVIAHPDAVLSNATPAFPDDVSPVAAIVAIVAIAPWAYVGFDNVPQAAEEFDFEPAKALRLIVLAILAAAGIYAAMISAVAFTAPWQAQVAEHSAWGSADAITGILGTFGLLLLAVAISMGVITGMNGFYLSASRLLLAMGRAEMVPPIFGRLHPRSRTPHIGIIFIGAICLITPWFGRAALTWVVDMSSIGVAVAYLYTCLCAYRFFARGASAQGTGAPEVVGTPVSKVLSLLGAITSVGFMALLLVPGSPALLGPQSLTALVVWVVLGLVFFVSRRKHFAALSDERVDELVLGGQRPEFLKLRSKREPFS